MERGQALFSYDALAILASEAPLPKRISVLIEVRDMPFAMGVALIVTRGAVVADQVNNLMAIGPGMLCRWPGLDPFILGRDFMTGRALGLDQPVLLAPQSPYFRHPQSSSPSKTPD